MTILITLLALAVVADGPLTWRWLRAERLERIRDRGPSAGH